MPKNPFLNSGLAALYIIAITSLMNFLSKSGPSEDNAAMPVLFLSLFTLSAAVMGYLFIGEPLQMYLAGEKKQAVAFFFKTLLGFAVFTVIALALSFSGVLPY
jgi:hypothetical protein